VACRRHPLPAVVVENRCEDLDHEQGPFEGPRPNEIVDENLCGGRIERPDHKPDAHTRERACDQGREGEKSVELFQEFEPDGIPGTSRRPLIHDQEEPASDCEMRNEHVQDADPPISIP
jgi:hypothetical protein